ncbi:MAG: sigma 54-interacting transcriptional regulator [Syntrophaceae bacterium]|nr:sigma 54-interacting transcriptional regulator [Syntrophaceae bacterium]
MPNRILLPEAVSETIEKAPSIFRPLLNQKFSILDFTPGEIISSGEEGKQRILCLLSGKAELSMEYRAAQDVVLDRLEPGDVFGDLAFLTGRAWPTGATLIATEESRFLEISTDRFQRILREIPEFTVELLKSLGKKTVKVDRDDFASPAKTLDPNVPATCAYPTHPGLPQEVQSRFCDLAYSSESVVIVGDKGVGKDILAYAIFDAADKYKEVLVPVDARKMGRDSFFMARRGAMDTEDQSRTTEQIKFLFGYHKVTQKGIVRKLNGYIELARDGALFIRGAHHLTPVTQQKLLDTLKTGFYCPLGSDEPVQIDFRLICHTNLHPSKYDPDSNPLLYELSRNALVIPPLRDRRELIPSLAQSYLEHYAREMNTRIPRLADLTLKAMIDYSWPGNDLELANAMRRAVLVAPGELVRRQDLTLDTKQPEFSLKYDLLNIKPIKQAVTSPLFPAILQSAFVPIFITIVLMLFLGPPDPSKNLAAMVMWSLAWPGMIVGALFGARILCSVCAIGALSKLAKKIISLEIPFPAALTTRSDFLIAGGILFIIWIECATDIRSSPFNLGLLLLSMFLIAFVLNTIWARQAWCRYICPLGGMNGLLARISMLELRADNTVCLSSCNTQECYFGGQKTEGCPFGQVVATLHSNQFCKLCGNCVKNCPHSAIRLNLRIPGYELGEVRYVRAGTGFLVLGLIGGLLSDMLTRGSWFDGMFLWASDNFMLRFTILFVGLIASVNIVSMIAVALSHRMFKERFWENYSRFALALLPLTALSFLAFHAFYLFSMGPQILGLLAQYLGIDGTPIPTGNVVSTSTIFFFQMIFIITGLVWTLITIYRLGIAAPVSAFSRNIGILPHVIFAVLVAATFTAVIQNVILNS